jgi:hypothetical protein
VRDHRERPDGDERDERADEIGGITPRRLLYCSAGRGTRGAKLLGGGG